MNFQISLAAARVNAGKTQDEAAKHLGVSKTCVISWEKGRTSPDATRLFEMCKYYGCPIEAIRLTD
jgi:DNA-binding XRE family transcriptional regulator